MADWFTSLANSAMKFADEIADSIVSQATEAQQQIRQEQKKLINEETQKQKIFGERHLLPWETDVESRQILSHDLMEKILTLSVHDRNFTVKAPNAHEVEFYFQEFVPVAMELLQLDSNLARVHAKLSPKMNEEDFWFNYYCRIVYLRGKSGIDGPEALSAAMRWNESDIVLNFEQETPVADAHFAVNPSSSKTGSNNPPPVPSSATSKPTASSSTRVAPSPATKNSIQSDEEELDLNDLDDVLNDSSLKDMELLEELGDISPEDFEQIGSSECNDELEAQIAQELAEGGDL